MAIFHVIGAEGVPFAAEGDVCGNRDLAKEIIRRAAPEELGAVMLTCRIWCTIIKAEPFLYGSFVMVCAEKFYQTKIAGVPQSVKGSPERAVKELAIVRLLRGDFNHADEMAAQLERPYLKFQVFLHGANEVISQEGESPIVHSLLTKANSQSTGDRFVSNFLNREFCALAKMMAAYDTSVAAKICELIPASKIEDFDDGAFSILQDRDLALLEIIKKEAAVKPDSAEDLVNKVTILENKSKALCQIARHNPKKRHQILGVAKKLLSQVKANHGSVMEETLIEITKVQALDNPVAALKTLSQSSKFGSDQMDVLSEIVKTAYEKNPHLPKDWISQMEDLDLRIKVQIEIAILEGDLHGAGELAKQIVFNEAKAHVWTRIAKLNPTFINQAAEFIRQVKNEWNKLRLFLEIAKLDPSYFDEVKQIDTHPQAWEKIVEAQAMIGDIDGAKNTALGGNCDSDIELIKWLLKIAKIDPVHDLSAVKAAAHAIEDLHRKFRGVCEVAKALLRNFAEVEELR
jgi:hypothetical protein